MMAFPVTAKLTGSIMIPSTAANPTRPMPPSSSRPKHSAGLSVRSARPAAAGSGAGDCRLGAAAGAPWLFAGLFPVVIDIHLRHSRAVWLVQPCLAASAGAADRSPGWAGRSAPGDIRKAGAELATADAAAVSQEPALVASCRRLVAHPAAARRYA